MANTTIKVNTEARDRLAVLAKERGCTIGELVNEFAQATPTREELQARLDSAVAYVREHLVPDFDETDVAAGKEMWRELAAGRLKTIE